MKCSGGTGRHKSDRTDICRVSLDGVVTAVKYIILGANPNLHLIIKE